MTAADFVQEMHSVWERLLLKLQRLPQAEPVEIATFSVLVIFAGKLRLPEPPQAHGSSWHQERAWCQPEGSLRQWRRSRGPSGGARGLP